MKEQGRSGATRRLRGATVAMAVLSGTAIAGPSLASAAISPVQLGALPGGSFSFALGANNVGQVVGQSEVTGGVSHPFLWTKETGMTDLGLLPGDNQGIATDINDAGEVIGTSVSNAAGTQGAFFWTRAGGMVDIGHLPGGSDTTPAAINRIGQVVGVSNFRAFSWTKAGGMVDLGMFPGDTSSSAVDVNDSGQVLGNSDNAGSRRAFVWTPADGMIDIGSLGGTQTAATDITNTGQVVGSSATADGSPHAFSWTRAGGMIDLGVLPTNTFSFAVGVNESGLVAANSDGFNGSLRRGFVWTQAGGVVAFGSSADISSTKAVNNVGQVVGRSGIPFGPFRTFVWTQQTGETELLNGEVEGITDSGTAFGYNQFAVIWETTRDTTPPSLAPSVPEPVYLNATGVVANPNATDDGSGIATQTCDPLDTRTVGDHTVTCRATDNAGNTAEAVLHYTVEYKILVLAPQPGSKWEATRTVPVRVVLADAKGIRISDATAAGLRRQCRVKLSAAGVQSMAPTCMAYEDHRFTGRVRLGIRTGAETLTVTVTYPGTTVTSTKSVSITVVPKL